MALSKLLVASLLVSLFLVQLAQADQKMVKTTGSGGKSIYCPTACQGRCSKALSSKWKLCMQACGAYCARCQCVPPATMMFARFGKS